MRRRRLFYIAATASAVLCIASAALWARSLKHHEQVRLSLVRYARPNELQAWTFDLHWYSNTLRVTFFRRTFVLTDWQWESSATALRSAYPHGFRYRFTNTADHLFSSPMMPGFAYQHVTQPAPAIGDAWHFAVRPWLPTLLSATLPLIWLYRRQSARSWRFNLRELFIGLTLCAIALSAFLGLIG
jgi:hypothetical protein